MYEVPTQNYTTVIRGMIQHENDVTNHRLMWLLIGQGFIANAFASGTRVGGTVQFLLPLVGIMLTLSTFGMLYNSYQARGYLQYLGLRAKLGTLPEEYLPFTGWPQPRVRNWWKDVWKSPWFKRKRDVFEAWIFIPYIFMVMWLTVLAGQRGLLERSMFLLAAIFVAAAIFGGFCVSWVSLERRDERVE